MKIKKPLKPLLWVLVLVMSLSLVAVFSSGGCRRAAPPVEESVIEEPAVEEIAEEPEEVGETIETKAEGLTSKDPDTATMDDLKDAIELAAEAQKAGLNEVAEDVLKWAKDVLNALGEKALSKDPCSAEIEDVENAIELAGEAQKIGLDDLADQLITWAKDGFQSYAAERTAAGADVKERTAMAAEAQKLGLDQLAEDLIAGEPIASPCEETWQGILEYTGEYSNPGMELVAQEHIQFTFKVDRQGGVQGTGRVKYECIKYVVYPAGPGSGPCPGTVEVPDFDVKISGAKTGQTFELKLEGTQESTMTVPPCSWDGSSFSMGPITGETPITFSYTILAQEGTQSLGPGCTVEIHKVTH